LAGIKPYLVGGHCYGGIVAFEIARRFTAQGLPAPLVVLIDTPAPGYPKVIRQWRGCGQESLRLIRGGDQALRDALTHTGRLRQFLKRRAARGIERVLIRAGLRGVLPAIEDHSAANERAARNYRLAPFSGRIVQFLSSAGPVRAAIWEDKRLSWREVAQGGFEAYPVPGDHSSMLAAPNATEIGTRLRELLAAEETRAVGAH
jgi:thioesterase domain-containing protein